MKLTQGILSAVVGTAICGSLLAVPTSVDARELRYAIGQPPGAIAVKAGDAYAEKLAELTDGKLTAKVHTMALLSMAETSDGVRDGMAHIGMVLTQYTPGNYPHTNFIADSSMILTLAGDKVRGKEAFAFNGAVSEFVFTKCPECNEEFKAQNQVYTGAGAGSAYGLVCTTPVTSAEDLAGKRLRVGSAAWGRWARHYGASPVTMSGNEMHEALSQGVVDCIVLSATEIRNFGLTETVTDITMTIPGGVFTASNGNVNANVWGSLSEEHRKALLRATTTAVATGSMLYHKEESEVLEEQKQRGTKLHEADPALVESTHRFIEQDLQQIAQEYKNNFGVERGQEMLEDFRVLLDKWIDLVQDVSTPEELADLYWSEIQSKVDVTRHGL